MDRQQLLRALAHAPSRELAPTLAPALVGVTLPDGTFACSGCWARVAARGCSIGSGAVLVWDGAPSGARCAGCGPEATS